VAALFTVTAQSPSTSSHRGKNGSPADAKPGEVRQITGPIRQHPPAGSQEPIGRSEQELPDTREATDNVRLAVDLVVLDAQVLQQKTGRIVGTLKKEDFMLAEDGVKQQVTHFSQDTLPLSVILLIDRGGCLDPFSDKVRHVTI